MRPIRNFMCCVLASVLLQQPAVAETSVEFRVGGTYSDNVRRSALNEEDQTIARAGLRLDTSTETRGFEGRLLADLEYRDFLDDAFEAENFSSAEANALFKFAPDVFHWVVEDKYGMLRRDQFDPDTPDNRENINTFSTGPDLRLRISNRTSVEVTARYRHNWFETSDTDNTTTSGSLALIRALSRNRSLSLNVSADRVEYDDEDLNSSFDRQTAYLSLNSQVSRGTLQFDIGVNELRDQGETFSGTLASLSWSRSLSEISDFSLTYSRRFSDAGDFFARFNSAGSDPQGPQEIIPSGDPFENERLSATYSYNRSRVRLSISAFFSEDEFQNDADLDRRRTGGRLNFDIGLGSGWQIGSRLRYEDRDFGRSDRNDDYLSGTIELDRRLARTLWLSLQYTYNDRSSNVSGQEYTENRYSLLFRFRPLGQTQ